MWLSINPGTTARPRRSIRRVAGPALRLAALDTFWRSEIDAPPVETTAFGAGALLAQSHRRPRRLAQLSLLANGSPRRLQHFEQSLVYGLGLHIVRRARHNLAKKLRRRQYVGALPPRHRRR